MLALVLSAVALGCKSSKKTATITSASPEKVKTPPEVVQPKPSEADEQAKLDAMKESTYKGRLSQYFDAIANASDAVSANTNIDEALFLFSSPQAPVLIVISEEGSQKDYDRPTTIRSYLNYLKDQKKNINRIENLKMDDSGKITEVELRKNN
ncbi:MAG: nucleoid-structuring protein H-NS [Bacteroidetes bacterium]|nr:nucleoid-structuring protein H-NS [Bacteroidota bacterium]